MGRTGTMFGFQQEGIRPDAFSLAKGLANGLPIGAMVCTEETGKALVPGSHGSTFGGNPVVAAAACATVRLAMDPRLLASNREKGEYFLHRGRAMQARHPALVKEIRGRGLLLGVELSHDAGPVVTRCRERGVLSNLAGERTVRFAPPYIVSESELDEGLRVLEDAVVALAPSASTVV
jgi:acetylornithine/N-succinyldiaminopimelate aminotransferase